MMKQKDFLWEINNSSFKCQCDHPVSYKWCKGSACEQISGYITYPLTNSNIIDIPAQNDFHFLVRVSTCGSYEPEKYFKEFEKRRFISFSFINRKNISRYGNLPLLAYWVPSELVVHMFPTDSNIDQHATTENELTDLPSLWLNLKKFDEVCNKLGVYNQITCKTKYDDNQILRPYAVVAINEPTEEDIKIAKAFYIKLIVVHPEKNAINYCGPLYKDYEKTMEVSRKLNKMYGISISHHYSKD